MVEHDLAKVGVAGSSPVFRSKSPLLTKRGFFLSSNSPGGEIGRHAGLKYKFFEKVVQSCNSKAVKLYFLIWLTKN